MLFTHIFQGAYMNILKQTVGIDVSYKSFDARFGTTNTQQTDYLIPLQKSFKNSLAGFKPLPALLKKIYPF